MVSRRDLIKGGLGLVISSISFGNFESDYGFGERLKTIVDLGIEPQREDFESELMFNSISHITNLMKDFGNDINDMISIFGLNSIDYLAILGVEQGKPYEGYSTGFKTYSGTGCLGLGQTTIGSVNESLNRANILFLKGYLEENILTRLDIDQHDENKCLSLKSLELSTKSPKFRPLETYLIKDDDGGEFDSAKFQIYSSGMHLFGRYVIFNDWELATCAYQIGDRATLELSVESNKNNLGLIIDEYTGRNYSSDDFYENPQSRTGNYDFMKEISSKEPTMLNSLKINYASGKSKSIFENIQSRFPTLKEAKFDYVQNVRAVKEALRQFISLS